MKKIGERYQQAKLNPKGYHTIIIGSGMSALTAGALLAKQGQRVLILERHYTAGGFTHVFRRKQFEWDIGLHYIGDVQRKGSMLRQLFDHITEERLAWADMGSVYDQAIFPDKSYDFVTGYSNFKEALYREFPKERQAIDTYFDYIFKSEKASRFFFQSKVLPPLLGNMVRMPINRWFYKYSDPTVFDVLKNITQDPKLIGVLTTQWGDYGLPPKQASFAMHAMVVRHYLSGASFPVGGSQSIADSIYPLIEKNGGSLFVRAEVDEILMHQNKAIGVRLKNGDEILASTVISSVGVHNTYRQLIPSALKQREKKVNNFPGKGVPPSSSHLCLYLGLNKSGQELQLPKANKWVFSGYDHDLNVARYYKGETTDYPVLYLSYPSCKDPTWEARYPGRSTIEAITLADMSQFSKWSETKWYNRGSDYDDLKEQISKKMITEIGRFHPEIHRHIVCYELSTPLSTKHFCHYQQGEIYGLSASPERFRDKRLTPYTPIKQLFLTGQDIVSPGVAGALLAGVITVAAMLKKNVLKGVV